MGQVNAQATEQAILAFLTALFNLIGGAQGSPIRVLISLGLGASMAGLFWMVIKAQIKILERQKAEEDTQKGHQDQIDYRVPQNKKDNEKDNANRSKLDSLE